MKTEIIKPYTPWLMLCSRLLLFAGIQSLFALGFYISGAPQPWEAGANWWLSGATLANMIGIVLLIGVFRAEGKNYWNVFQIRKENIRGDILIVLGLILIGGLLGYPPNPILAKAFFGDIQLALPLLIRPIPFGAAYASILLFPITQGLVELPTYFGYVMPRLESQGMRRWFAIAVPVMILSLQHIALPLLFDLRFILWRGLMFLPFAFFLGMVLHRRPRLLPYMAVVHMLMDLSFAVMFLSAAY